MKIYLSTKNYQRLKLTVGAGNITSFDFPHCSMTLFRPLGDDKSKPKVTAGRWWRPGEQVCM